MRKQIDSSGLYSPLFHQETEVFVGKGILRKCPGTPEPAGVRVATPPGFMKKWKRRESMRRGRERLKQDEENNNTIKYIVP